MASHENMTLCHDRCESGCKTYAVPLSKCFSPPRLWPDDPQWGSHDVRDDCINSTYFRRTFFKTSDGSCGNKSSGFELPIGACVGPFGKPRPWGVFHLNCAADPWAAAVDTLSSASNKSFHSLVSPLSVMVKLSYTATTGSYFNKSEANATVDGWERSFTANPAVGMRALLFAQNATRRGVIAFRGTDLGKGASSDCDRCADALLWDGVPISSLPSYCKPFSNATLDYWASALAFVAKVRKERPDLALLFTGHSLGAGLAFAVAAATSHDELAPAVAFASPPWLGLIKRQHVPPPTPSEARRRFYALADEWDPVQRESIGQHGVMGTQCLWASPEPPTCKVCYAHTPFNASSLACLGCFAARHIYAHYLNVDVPGKRAVCKPLREEEEDVWTAASGPATIRVTRGSFKYEVLVDGLPWLTNGTVAFTCGGKRYSSDLGTLTPIGASLASPTGIVQHWAAGTCANLTTSILNRNGALEFVTTIGSSGADGTSTMPLSTRKGYRGRPVACNTSTEFPSLSLPPSKGAAGIGWATWDGDFLFGPFRSGRPSSNTSSADVRGGWHGGLSGGPLLLYNNIVAHHPTALVIGTSASHKVGILHNGPGGKLIGGAQGMIPRLPADYELRFALVSRIGVTAAALSYGSHVKSAGEAAAADRKLTLADDVLSSRLHYVTDGGALENYCDYWPACTHSNGSRACVPMHTTLAALKAYHAKLALNVSLYHLDPFWWSQEPFGGCKLGAFAQTLTPSPFHFPDGLGKLQTPMQLIVKWFTDDNEYKSSYRFEGNNVGGADSARFWKAQLTRLVNTAGLKSLVWDGLDFTWMSSDARVNNTHEQDTADAGLAGAAFALKLPMRVDTALPSDVLGSGRFGAYTAQRVTGDANPHDYFEANNWLQYASNAIIPASMGVRPMLDVLWTNGSAQFGDPRWKNCSRKNVRHDLSIAVMSAGPVGFGDLLNGTDQAVLTRAMRTDGVLLKPCFPILRVDRWFTSSGGSEIWAAVSGPAGGTNARTDARANSMADLLASGSDARWSWQILSTNVDGSQAAGRPLELSELWPQPPAGTVLLVATVDEHVGGRGDGAGAAEGGVACIHDAKASSCLSLWSASSPLNVSTAPAAGLHRSFKLQSAAPVLDSGWTLLGDLSKVVPVSPQRFVAEAGGAAPQEADLALAGGKGLQFSVIGASGEVVNVTLVAPPKVDGRRVLDGVIVKVQVRLGEAGRAEVRCEKGACAVQPPVQ